MSKLSCGLGAALLVLAAAPAGASEGMPPTEPSAAMAGLPVFLVVPDEPLRPTVAAMLLATPQQTRDVAARARGHYQRDAGAGTAGNPASQLLYFGAIRNRSVRIAVPGYRLLRDSGCLVNDADVLVQEAGAAIHALPGFAQARIAHVVDPKDIPAAAREQPLIVVTAVHGLAPDYSAVVTSVLLSVHSPRLPDAPRKWQREPALSRQLVVVSDRLQLPPKTPADAARLVAAENARFEGFRAQHDALVRKGKAGDNGARVDAKSLRDRHERELEEAQAREWTLGYAAARRAELLAQGDCAPLKAALVSNRAEAMRLLSLALTDALPTDLPRDWTEPGFLAVGSPDRALATDPVEALQRRLYIDDPSVVLSRRAGDDVMIDYRYQWLPRDSEEVYERVSD